MLLLEKVLLLAATNLGLAATVAATKDSSLFKYQVVSQYIIHTEQLALQGKYRKSKVIDPWVLC